MDKTKLNDLISIIIPVYNVSQYLDICLKTVTSQTYSNLEIILINDGSTDDSNTVCRKWEKLDNRIIYIEKQNEGLGPTRNYGIEIAKGEYIAFVDSDDWISTDYIEKLYSALRTGDADIAECDFYRVYNYSGEKAYFEAAGMAGREFTKEEKILYATVVQWNKLSKRRLWQDNNIKMPNCSGEDLAVNMMLLILADKIVNVHEALYYYRMGRCNSISNSKNKFYSYIKSAQYLIDSFKSKDMFLDNKELIYRHILRWTSRYLSIALGRLEEKEYMDLRDKWVEFLDDNFPNRCKKKYILVGGYNLGRIAIKLPLLEDPYQRYQFSNMISLMAEEITEPYDVDHPNPYRKIMLQRDYRKDFRKVFKNIDTDFILIDFIEERFGVLKAGNSYITYSDAVKDMDEIPFSAEVINENSSSGKKLWEESCLKFIKMLKTRFTSNQIILVENYLTEYYGTQDCRITYSNIDEIREINKLLSLRYEFFMNHCSGISIVRPSGLNAYYTDEKYEYGCYPWHLNELVNIQIADIVEKYL